MNECPLCDIDTFHFHTVADTDAYLRGDTTKASVIDQTSDNLFDKEKQ